MAGTSDNPPIIPTSTEAFPPDEPTETEVAPSSPVPTPTEEVPAPVIPAVTEAVPVAPVSPTVAQPPVAPPTIVQPPVAPPPIQPPVAPPPVAPPPIPRPAEVVIPRGPVSPPTVPQPSVAPPPIQPPVAPPPIAPPPVAPPPIPNPAEIARPPVVPTAGGQTVQPTMAPAGGYGGPPTSVLGSTETLPAADSWNTASSPPGLTATGAAVRTTASTAKGKSAGGLALVAVLVILVGAWGGIVPFLGPSIHFNADGSSAWHLSLRHELLWLAPGALALLMGILLLAHVRKVKSKNARFGSVWTGFLTALSGAWFVAGPLAWPVLKSSETVFRPATPTHELLYQLGWSLGPGIVLILLGGCAIGFALRR